MGRECGGGYLGLPLSGGIMFTRSHDRAGLGPAENLPPTLQPQAVLSMAPEANRRLSFLASCLVYLGCGIAVSGLSQVQAKPRGNPFTQGMNTVDVEFPPALPPVATVAPPPPPMLAQARPQSGETLPPPPPDAVSDTLPGHLPTEDLSTKGLTGPANPTGTPSSVLPPGAVQVPSGFVPVAAAPVLMAFDQMVVRSQVPPNYPPMARLAKVQGSVVLLMTVDVQGIPAEVQLLQGVHPSLDAESLRVARLWRFEPARVNGAPVVAQFRLTLNFRLK